MPFDEKVVFKHPYVDLLTSEQALADYAVLLTYLKSELGAKDCPVIAFGGSYGGMLSAYMRMKYPNVIDGAIAASAPINLVAGVSDREFFFKIVTKDFAQAAAGCDTCVKKAFRDVHDLFMQGSTGQATIKKTFNLCKETSTQADYTQLLYWIRNSFVNLAMMDYPYPTSFLVTLPGYPVKVACQKMMQSQTAIQGLAKITELVSGNKSCHDIYKEYTACSDPTGCGTGVEGYPWDYQACTEFGMPAGTDGETDMFPALPFTLKQRDAYCQKRWGVTPRNYWAYVNYFGDRLHQTSNIVFSNGNLDPWHGGGVLKNISSSVVAVMIEGGAHHLDLRASDKADPPSVITARELEKQHIRKWISEHAKRGHREL